MGQRQRHAPLHAAGDLEAMARAWWKAKMQGETLGAITVAGDGCVRFHWTEPGDFGTYRLPLWRLYEDVPHRLGVPLPAESRPSDLAAKPTTAAPATDETNPTLRERGE